LTFDPRDADHAYLAARIGLYEASGRAVVLRPVRPEDVRARRRPRGPKRLEPAHVLINWNTYGEKSYPGNRPPRLAAKRAAKRGLTSLTRSSPRPPASRCRRMKLAIEYVRPDALVPAPYNPRRISDEALKRLGRLLDEHGFVDPIVARREDRLVIGGHQRLKANALRKTPDELVPVVFVEGVSDERAKALNIALNNPAAQGEYDLPKLGELLAELDTGPLDVPEVTGLDNDEVERIIKSLEGLTPVEVPETPTDPSAAEVVLIFELSAEQYRRLKGDFDRLISEYDLSCHVRMDEQ